MPSSVAVQTQLGAALRALKKLDISFRGPFVTPQRNCVYVVDECIVTYDEIVSFHQQGKLNDENKYRFLLELRDLQRRRPQSGRD